MKFVDAARRNSHKAIWTRAAVFGISYGIVDTLKQSYRNGKPFAELLHWSCQVQLLMAVAVSGLAFGGLSEWRPFEKRDAADA